MCKLLLGLFALLCFSSASFADGPFGGGNAGGGGSVTVGPGLKIGANGSCAGGYGATIYPCAPIVTKAGSYSVQTTDLPATFVMNCASACTLTIPQADANGNYQLQIQSIGTGTVTLSPTTSSIYGAPTSLTQNGWAYLSSDGTNYSGQSNQLGTGGSSGANPSATASDTANNGVAPTFMRSDASPAVQKGSSSQFGLMKCDGTTVTCPGGVLSASGGGGGSGAGCPDFGYATGGYYTMPEVHKTTVGLLANVMYAIPICISESVTFTKLTSFVTTGAVGSHVEMLVYNNSAGAPSTKVSGCDSGSKSSATSGAKAEGTGLTCSLTAGAYFLVLWTDNTATVYGVPIDLGSPAPDAWTGDDPTSNTSGCYWVVSQAFVGGSPPATWPGGSCTETGAPLVWLGK
jgi:hypothetical protein